MLTLLLRSAASSSAPILDTTATGKAQSNTLSIPITVAVQTNRLLVVSISTQDANHDNLPITGVTVNGVAMTKAKEANSLGDVHAEEWFYIGPSTGSNTVVIQSTGLCWIGAVVSSFYNCNQTAQPHTTGESAENGVQADVSLTPLVNRALIVDALSSEAARISLDATQTTLGTNQGTVQQNISASYKVLAPASSVNMLSYIRPAMPWAYVGVAYNPSATTLTYPTISTSVPTDVNIFDAQFNGNISNTGGSDVLRRGFQYNTVQAPGLEVFEDGIFSSGAFSLDAIDLNPNTTYYVRAFASNALGISYGDWVTIVTDPATYNIIINGVDRTTDVINGSVVIEDIINDQNNTCFLRLIDVHNLGIPDTDEEIIITLDDGSVLFGGYIISVDYGSTQSTGAVEITLKCLDYVRLLDRNLVHRTYESMTDLEIIQDIINRYCVGSGITINNVIEGPTIDQISFNYVQPSQALRRLADISGKNWYIDYQKDIHFFPMTTNPAPFNIDSSNNQYINLKIRKDASQIKNRIYVRGGTKLSDFTTYVEVGDGQKRKFTLPDKPHDVTVEVDTGAGYVTKSVGIKNIDTTGYDWYLNFQEKYLEQDSGGSVLTSAHKIRVTYKYDIPILIAQENSASIIEHGVHEFPIFDKSIRTTEAARERALAELTDYQNNVVEGSFTSYTPGFVSGQYIHINSTPHEVDEDYIIQKVIARSFGAGNYRYEISIASAKTMGIIRFLIELLEANKNLIELDDNEVIDELLSVTDSLLSDSLLDSLTIDSAGAYATWCTADETSPSTRARWDLFQWG